MHDTPHNPRNKCGQCGLVNTANDEVCRRCGTSLTSPEPAQPITERVTEPEDQPAKRGFLKRLSWIIGATLIALIAWYISLLLTSDGLQPDQKQKVESAIAILQQQGFAREAFVLKYLTTFRSSDNWLNAYVGHRDAYAATNFPFEVVTLYPDFFELPIDDRERAAVLLHEARHLFGDGEDAALELTWKRKTQLGWTADKYAQTRVWDATQALTRGRFPYFFQCGAEGKADCY
ncbi:MAG TPA: hypothetical protein VJT71_13915 [Pyrinomonadaceae bacterium]|nr:hypothetical protein [Pyrinomonadaceae bacterium]